jgi:large subunit ribosomal protein L9
MKVLLCEDVADLGWYGDVVDVKAGYARNCLLPQGLAVAPSETAVKSMAAEKAQRDQQRHLKRREQERLVAAVEGAEVIISAKANELGHLFGSVMEKDVADKLAEQGLAVTADMVRMSGHIKELGSHEVTVKVSPDLKATVRVMVVSEENPDQQGQAVESAEEENQG